MARPKKVSDSLTHFSLKIGSEVIESKGETILEALAALPRPDKIFLKGVLTISQGDKKTEILLQPQRIKRLFYKVCWHQLSKQLALLLK